MTYCKFVLRYILQVVPCWRSLPYLLINCTLSISSVYCIWLKKQTKKSKNPKFIILGLVTKKNLEVAEILSGKQLRQRFMVMFWSQSDTEHLDCISSRSPPCNYEHKNGTHHRTKCGHNMFTDLTDFREQFWQKKNRVKANSHKQISHIQHVSFKQSDRDSVKLCHIAAL